MSVQQVRERVNDEGDKVSRRSSAAKPFDKEQREMRGTNPMVVSERTQVRDRTTEVCDKAVRR